MARGERSHCNREANRSLGEEERETRSATPWISHMIGPREHRQITRIIQNGRGSQPSRSQTPPKRIVTAIIAKETCKTEKRKEEERKR